MRFGSAPSALTGPLPAPLFATPSTNSPFMPEQLPLSSVNRTDSNFSDIAPMEPSSQASPSLPSSETGFTQLVEAMSDQSSLNSREGSFRVPQTQSFAATPSDTPQRVQRENTEIITPASLQRHGEDPFARLESEHVAADENEEKGSISPSNNALTSSNGSKSTNAIDSVDNTVYNASDSNLNGAISSTNLMSNSIEEPRSPPHSPAPTSLASPSKATRPSELHFKHPSSEKIESSLPDGSEETPHTSDPHPHAKSNDSRGSTQMSLDDNEESTAGHELAENDFESKMDADDAGPPPTDENLPSADLPFDTPSSSAVQAPINDAPTSPVPPHASTEDDAAIDSNMDTDALRQDYADPTNEFSQTSVEHESGASEDQTTNSPQKRLSLSPASLQRASSTIPRRKKSSRDAFVPISSAGEGVTINDRSPLKPFELAPYRRKPGSTRAEAIDLDDEESTSTTNATASKGKKTSKSRSQPPKNSESTKKRNIKKMEVDNDENETLGERDDDDDDDVENGEEKHTSKHAVKAEEADLMDEDMDEDVEGSPEKSNKKKRPADLEYSQEEHDDVLASIPSLSRFICRTAPDKTTSVSPSTTQSEKVSSPPLKKPKLHESEVSSKSSASASAASSSPSTTAKSAEAKKKSTASAFASDAPKSTSKTKDLKKTAAAESSESSPPKTRSRTDTLSKTSTQSSTASESAAPELTHRYSTRRAKKELSDNPAAEEPETEEPPPKSVKKSKSTASSGHLSQKSSTLANQSGPTSPKASSSVKASSSKSTSAKASSSSQVTPAKASSSSKKSAVKSDKAPKAAANTSDVSPRGKKSAAKRSSAKRTTASNSAHVILSSGLTPNTRKYLAFLTDELGGKLESSFTNAVTHLVVSVDKDGTPNRTLKYLEGLIRGVPIVTVTWVLDSLEQKKYLSVDPYIVQDISPNSDRSRIFKKHHFILYGSFDDEKQLQLAEIEHLLRLTGATSEHVKSASARDTATIFEKSSAQSHTVIVCDPKVDHTKVLAIGMATDTAPLTKDWILDCIHQGRLVDTEQYSIVEPASDDLDESITC